MSAHSLCVAIPMFNEAPNVERCVRAVSGVIERMEPRVDLLCIDDGSTDETESLLASCTTRFPRLSFVRHQCNRGYGLAIETATREARKRGYGAILFMDSDLTNDPALIPKFVALLEDGYDLVKASRYVPGGRMEGVPAGRQWVSRLGNWVASHLFRLGIRDCTNGFRAVRLEKLEGLRVRERGFASILEELCHLKRVGVRVAEIPYTLRARRADDGLSKFRYRPGVFWAYFRYALMASTIPTWKRP